METLGVDKNRFAFYPFDEPQTRDDIDLLIFVTRLIKEVDARLMVYTTIDSLDRFDRSSLAMLIRSMDILQISDRDWNHPRRKMLDLPGKIVWLYSGGGKQADPFLHYRLQAWKAFSSEASGIGFWAYADTGPTGTAWDDFDGIRHDFAVIYEGNGQIISSKRWEAWREGVEDFELLLQAKRKLKPGSETTEFKRRVEGVLEQPGDYDSFLKTRRFLLAIASR
jgi:hypothetical protein